MIKLKLREPKTKRWKKWRKDGNKQAAEHLAALRKGEKAKINEALYKREKAVFVELSNGLCAYCGVMVSAGQPGDIEHYRPKGGVQNIDFKNVEVDYGDGAGPVKHRGYPWLAYDCSNLLLSCAGCNRKTKLAKDRYYGKDQRFPVKGTQAYLPEHLEQEEPLLLHPGVDDPAAHLDYEPTSGLLHGTSDKGQCTIDVLGLNLRELPAERIEVYGSVQNAVWAYVRAYEYAQGGVPPEAKTKQLATTLARVKKGKHPFPMIARLAFVDAKSQIEAARTRLGDV